MSISPSTVPYFASNRAPYNVAIIGAGPQGVHMAKRLQDKGVEGICMLDPHNNFLAKWRHQTKNAGSMEYLRSGVLQHIGGENPAELKDKLEQQGIHPDLYEVSEVQGPTGIMKILRPSRDDFKAHAVSICKELKTHNFKLCKQKF